MVIMRNVVSFLGLGLLGLVVMVLSLVALVSLAWDRSGRISFGQRQPMAAGDEGIWPEA